MLCALEDLKLLSAWLKVGEDCESVRGLAVLYPSA